MLKRPQGFTLYPMVKLSYEDARRMLDDGMSRRAIAAEVGLTPARVGQILKAGDAKVDGSAGEVSSSTGSTEVKPTKTKTKAKAKAKPAKKGRKRPPVNRGLIKANTPGAIAKRRQRAMIALREMPDEVTDEWLSMKMKSTAARAVIELNEQIADGTVPAFNLIGAATALTKAAMLLSGKATEIVATGAPADFDRDAAIKDIEATASAAGLKLVAARGTPGSGSAA